MRAERPRGIEPAAGSIEAERFVMFYRNRVVGVERVNRSFRPDGGLDLRSVTAITVGGFILRQSVRASFDGRLRPQRCRVIASGDSGDRDLQITIRRHDITIRDRAGGKESSRSIRVRWPPLLLVDNCFALHALAARLLGIRAVSPDKWIAVPAGAQLSLTTPAPRSVWLGGQDLGTPDVSMRLTPELDEHVWMSGGTVKRLAIPQQQVRVERVAGAAINGGM